MEKEPESGEGDILRLEAFFSDIFRLPKRLDTLLSSTLEFDADAISSSSMVCSLFLHSSALLVVLRGAQSLLGVNLRGPVLPKELRAPPRRT